MAVPGFRKKSGHEAREDQTRASRDRTVGCEPIHVSDSVRSSLVSGRHRSGRIEGAARACRPSRQSSKRRSDSERSISRRDLAPALGLCIVFLSPTETFAQRLAALRASVQSAATAKESTLLEQMRAIFGTTKFEGGKIHDVVFLGMPKLDEDATLSRSSPRLGTRETFFYLAMLLNVGGKVDTLNQAAGFSGAMQRIFQAFTDGGLTADDWKAAFGTEVESVADWPSSAHWPTLLVTLPVLNMAKAGNIVEAVTRADEAAWRKTEKDGVRYFSKQSPANLVAVTPTIALSDRILLVALNPVSAEEAVKRSVGASSELADSQTYKAATRLLPPPTNFFAYVDTALLYSRLDASLRPILMLAAAFMPSVATDFDLAKIPSLEVITKHLSPIVTSQRY